MSARCGDADVRRVGDDPGGALRTLLARFDIELIRVPAGEPIPGSHWGAPEAGVVGQRVYARSDTPVHSVLHEAAHIICMTPDRRAVLNRDAGGDELEEAAVCYLQVVLAVYLPEIGRRRLMRDMDAWGYSFRLGSASRWFEEDADDARGWLEARGLLCPACKPRWIFNR